MAQQPNSLLSTRKAKTAKPKPIAKKQKPRSLISHTVFDNQTTADEWMTIEQAAAWLQTKPSHIRDLIHQNAIPSSKLGQKRRLHRPTIRDWLLTQ